MFEELEMLEYVLITFARMKLSKDKGILFKRCDNSQCKERL